MTTYHPGLLVTHPNKPEWGPGKVVHVDGRSVHVIWRDLPERVAKCINVGHVPLPAAAEQSDEVLDNLPPLKGGKDGKWSLPRERVAFDAAVSSFLRRFPQGFADLKYLAGERDYKWQAHEHFVETLGGGQLAALLESDLEEAMRRVKACEAKVNLLSVFEKAALRDALADHEAARRFLAGLVAVLDADEPDEAVMSPYFQVVGDLPADRSRVATWAVATLLPFLARPDRHMFLKPKVTKNAAEALAFDLHYDAAPNWLTYSRLLRMAELYRRKLEAWRPRDLIDVQSFLWSACGGYDGVK